MSQYPHPRITNWTAAYQDRWAWMYALNRHYAYLRDTANLLYAAGMICIESRNRMVLDAFKQFMSHSEHNNLAEISYQHHYHYEVWEDGKQVAELVCTGHVRQLGTNALLGAVTLARPPDEGFIITRRVDYQEELVGRVNGLTIDLENGSSWQLKLAIPSGFSPKDWQSSQ